MNNSSWPWLISLWVANPHSTEHERLHIKLLRLYTARSLLLLLLVFSSLHSENGVTILPANLLKCKLEKETSRCPSTARTWRIGTGQTILQSWLSSWTRRRWRTSERTRHLYQPTGWFPTRIPLHLRALKSRCYSALRIESERNWYPATQHDWLAKQLHYTKRFLLPLHSPTPTCWFSHCPMGHHPLCPGYATGGIEDYKTNHSLRATSTSRLYQSGVDEQLIMEWSGHRTQFLMSRSMPCSISWTESKDCPVTQTADPPSSTGNQSWNIKETYCPTHQVISCTFNFSKYFIARGTMNINYRKTSAHVPNSLYRI